MNKISTSTYLRRANNQQENIEDKCEMDRDLIPFFKEDEIPYNFVTQTLGTVKTFLPHYLLMYL